MNELSKDKKKRKIELANYFEKGFEQKDWVNVGDLKLPVQLKILGVDEYESRFGKTYRYTFETSTGQEARLLCKGNTFHKVMDEIVPRGATIEINKNEKGYWIVTDVI